MASRRSKSFTVEFSGVLDIRSIPDTHDRMRQALADHPAVTARIAADATCDLTFVQLMESSRRTAREAGKALALAAPAEGPLLETLRRGGFLAEPAGREFWLMESGEQ